MLTKENFHQLQKIVPLSTNQLISDTLKSSRKHLSAGSITVTLCNSIEEEVEKEKVEEEEKVVDNDIQYNGFHKRQCLFYSFINTRK